MLPGINRNVRYRGLELHVQTEDSGRRNPHVITHLFFGGTIVTTRRDDYQGLLGGDEETLRRGVRQLMEGQHKGVLRDLISGRFDEVLGLDAQTAPPNELTSQDLPPETPAPPPPAPPPPPPAPAPPVAAAPPEPAWDPSTAKTVQLPAIQLTPELAAQLGAPIPPPPIPAPAPTPAATESKPDWARSEDIEPSLDDLPAVSPPAAPTEAPSAQSASHYPVPDAPPPARPRPRSRFGEGSFEHSSLQEAILGYLERKGRRPPSDES